jgi:hypothetical protein
MGKRDGSSTGLQPEVTAEEKADKKGPSETAEKVPVVSS